jgi:hypothetical protein
VTCHALLKPLAEGLVPTRVDGTPKTMGQSLFLSEPFSLATTGVTTADMLGEGFGL